MPLGRMEPPISQEEGMSPHAVETQNHRARVPITRNHVLSIGEDRTHFHPSAQMLIGSRKMLTPKSCRKKSAHWVPNKPNKLWVRRPWLAVFQDGSVGEWDTRLSETAKPTERKRSPTVSLS